LNPNHIPQNNPTELSRAYNRAMSRELLSHLWSNARHALTRLRRSLLPLDTLDKKERRDLGRWLTALEAFVRRIVLVEALSLEVSKLDREPPGSHARREARAPTSKRKRPPRLRLWPQPKRTGPRIRQLGPPVLVRDIWREQRRAALIARLTAARGRRRKPHIILADRIDALESILAAPMRAARRLARKLTQLPRLAFKLAFTPTRPVPGIDQAIPHDAQSAAVKLALNSS
jgi:hypothetical protein